MLQTCDICGKDYSKEHWREVGQFVVSGEVFNFCGECSQKIREMVKKESE